MARADTAIYGFNGGVISKSALTRVDMERVRVSCEQMNNWMARVVGEMSTRPGSAWLGSVKSDGQGKFIPFIYSAAATALIELTNAVMRVWVADVLVTRVSVSAAIANGGFTGSLTSWTDDDEAGAASAYSANQMELLGTGTSYARRYQLVTLGGGDSGKVHALQVVVTRGPVKIRVGSTSTASDYMAETVLRTGRHSLSFTPTGNFYVVLYSKDNATRYVDSIAIESAGAMELVTPWNATEARTVRSEQSADVVFCAVDGKKQQRIERHSFTSWSIVDYDVEDGPFRLPNLDTGVTITPSAVSGNITLTASEPLFSSGHPGALWQLTHAGQTATATLTGDDQFTAPIRVTGVNEATINTRLFLITISGISGDTLTLQRSLGAPGAWEDVSTFAADGSSGYTDDLDNQIVYYRIGIKTGDYGAGTVAATLIYTNSSQVGIVKITAVASAVSASAEVVTTLGKASATSDWREGYWSTYRGFPASVTIYDGRLWWGMRDMLFGSISDAFASYDQSLEGDAGPIIRSISIGPVEGLYWLLPQQRLLTGSASQEVSVRSSSFDEPLTPTKFTARRCSSRGSANVAAANVDTSGIFVQRDGRRVYELAYMVEAQDYASRDMTRLSAKICNAGVTSMAVQRQPDTRIWCDLADGTSSILLYERGENVAGWFTFDTPGASGLVEDVVVLPGTDEDQVYLLVNRTIGGVTKRYLEKLAKESEARCGTINKTADAHIVWAGGATSTVTGLSHLEGKQVTVWYNGAAIHDQSNMLTVASGQVTTASPIGNGAVIGLPYTSRYKSMKLAFAAGLGSALEQRKRVDHLGLLLTDTAWKGLRLGRDFDNLRAFPKMYQGKALADAAVLTDYDYDMSSFNGGWSTDSRVCIEVKSPYAATVEGMVVAQITNDKDAPVKEAA